MAVKDTTIRLKPLDHPWQVVGVETGRGIWAEDVQLTSDKAGPLSAQFTLHRDTRRRWPDLQALTSVEVEVGGVLVWSGQLRDSPSGVDALSVDCEGAQADLDKDLIRRMYVHTRLAEWKDARSYPTTPLTSFRTNGSVQSVDGAVVVGFPSGATVVPGDAAGVTLDLGPSLTAKRVVVTFQNQGFIGSDYTLMVKGNDSPATLISGGENAVAVNPASGGGTGPGGLVTARRYISIIVYKSGGSTAVESADRLVRVLGVQVFRDASYESGNASILKADTVVRDALTNATTEIVLDLSRIDATAFSIPSFAPDGPKAARDMVSAVNAYHNWLFKITEQRRPVFRALPTVPLVKVGAGVAFVPEDASGSSAEEIYDKVLLSWDTPEGTKGELTRTSTGSLVSRQGQHNAKELQIGSTLPADGVAATQIGDTWLAAHTTTPFKGSATITGPVEHIATGARVPPERLLMLTGELLQFDGQVNPDTGATTRDGRISQVTYTPADDTAKVTIDDSRTDVDALLSRLAVVTGGG